MVPTAMLIWLVLVSNERYSVIVVAKIQTSVPPSTKANITSKVVSTTLKCVNCPDVDIYRVLLYILIFGIIFIVFIMIGACCRDLYLAFFENFCISTSLEQQVNTSGTATSYQIETTSIST